MDEELSKWFGTLSALFIGVFAPVGLIFSAVRTFIFIRPLRLQPYLLGLCLTLICLSILRLPTHDWLGAKRLLGQGLVVTLAFLTLKVRRQAVIIGFSLTLIIFLGGALFQRWMSAHSWQSYPPSLIRSVGLNSKGVIDQIKGTIEHPWDSSSRSWSVAKGTTTLELSLAVRLLSGTPGWDWLRSSPEFHLSHLEKHGEHFTRVQSPPDSTAYLRQGINTHSPIAGKTFKASIEMRSVGSGSQPFCGKIYLAEVGGRYAKGESVCVDSMWQEFDITWQAPPAARKSRIDLVVTGFDRREFDIRQVYLEVLNDDHWQLLSPLDPTGVEVSLTGSPAVSKNWRFYPTGKWETYRLKLADGELNHTSMVTARLKVERGLLVETKNVTLTALGSGSINPNPLPNSKRQELWFQEPNLAGHTMATVGLVLLSTTQSTWIGLLALVLTVFDIRFTGSRAAWLAALIGLPWMLWLVCRRRERWWIFSLLALSATAFFIFFGADTLGRLQFYTEDINPVSRPEIWRTAWQAFTSHFWNGIGAQNFTAYWQMQHPNAFVVTHAHNLWLQFAASYGIFGLLAILWLTAGFVTLAWRWGRWRGLALVLPVLVMQLFDYTLFYSGVLFPLILGMNALRQRFPAIHSQSARLDADLSASRHG